MRTSFGSLGPLGSHIIKKAVRKSNVALPRCHKSARTYPLSLCFDLIRVGLVLGLELEIRMSRT
jgi:hypothetical protein